MLTVDIVKEPAFGFVDMHSHALCGVDDGPRSYGEMCQMIDASYSDGVRTLFLTPHFSPRHFGDNCDETDQAFRLLSDYVQDKYPDMRLVLANELRCSRDCVSWLERGLCRTLCESRYVLVDFSLDESTRAIADGLSRLLNAGYIPILAHPERYRRLGFGMGELRAFRDDGVLLQMNAQSLLGGFGLGAKMRAEAMLRKGLVDFMGSDAHGLRSRPPQLSQAFSRVQKKYGESRARDIFCDNALKLIRVILVETKAD